ncbi:MAG: transposase [Bdellovibrionales bacterium]|nr:transposase [Bdellovibrionales bacterium]
MPRPLRIIYPGVPHHIVHRGCKQQQVFFCEKDYEYYIDLLSTYLTIFEVEIWTYCLMPNHVHLILVPNDETSLSKAIGLAHKKYSFYLNKKIDWKGTIWEGRFKSYGMDEYHTYHALKYVERNPVAARMVENCENYKWSSASAHVINKKNKLIRKMNPYWESSEQWKEYISSPGAKELEYFFEKHEKTGRFLGIHKKAK